MIKLFSGTAHPKLSDEVSKLLNNPLSKVEILRFQDSEVKITVQEDVKDQTCVIIQPTSNPTDENLMELLLFCDALRRSEAKKIIAIIPMFGYARQNVQHRPGECVSTHVVIKFLEAVGFDEVYTFDLHDEGSQGIFSIPFASLSPFPAFVPAMKEYLGSELTRETTVICTPDQEGIERARRFGEAVFGDTNFPTATVNKKRDTDNMHQSKALELYGDVKDKTVIIVDDICTSGGTLIHAADLCMERGAKRVLCAISHHDFAPDAPQKIQNSVVEKFFTSNSIPLKEDHRFEKLQEVSIAALIVENLQNE